MFSTFIKVFRRYKSDETWFPWMWWWTWLDVCGCLEFFCGDVQFDNHSRSITFEILSVKIKSQRWSEMFVGIFYSHTTVTRHVGLFRLCQNFSRWSSGGQKGCGGPRKGRIQWHWPRSVEDQVLLDRPFWGGRFGCGFCVLEDRPFKYRLSWKNVAWEKKLEDLHRKLQAELDLLKMKLASAERELAKMDGLKAEIERLKQLVSDRDQKIEVPWTDVGGCEVLRRYSFSCWCHNAPSGLAFEWNLAPRNWRKRSEDWRPNRRRRKWNRRSNRQQSHKKWKSFSAGSVCIFSYHVCWERNQLVYCSILEMTRDDSFIFGEPGQFWIILSQ